MNRLAKNRAGDIGTHDAIGTSVALAGDAASMIIAVGSPATNASIGRVYQLTVMSNNTKNVEDSHLVGDLQDDKFGTSVALSDDGATLVVGAPQDSAGYGYARVYRNSTGTSANPVYAQLDDGSPVGTDAGSLFGTAVAISGNGSRIAVGAPGSANGEVTAWEYVTPTTVTTTTITTTTITTTTITTTTTSNCVDVTLSDGFPWVSTPDGHDCDHYAQDCNGGAITTYADILNFLAARNEGYNAMTACCACGGGVLAIPSIATPVGSAIAGNSNKGIGSAVSLSDDGNTVIAGGREGDGDFGVYTWSGSWQANLPEPTTHDPSGHSVAISGDGSRFVVTDDDNSNGHVHVYDRLGTPGASGQLWKAPETVDTLTGTGCSAALTTNGSRLAVGACNSNPKVRLYAHEGTQWSAATELEVTGPGTSLFGHSVAIAETGSDSVVAVGAPAHADGGKVYLFLATDYTSPKEVSTPTDILTFERFGQSVSLSADGSVLAVGSPDFGEQNAGGAVRIFDVVYGATGDDTATTHVRTLFGNEGDEFGTSVSLSPDGQTLFVGAPGANLDTGYVAVYDGSDDWIRVKTVDGESESRFGTSVSAAEPTNEGTIRFAAGAPGVANMPGQIRMYDIGTAEPTSTSSGTSAANLGAIIGGSVGGVALIAAAVYFWRPKGDGEGSASTDGAGSTNREPLLAITAATNGQ
jgi:hypothetical protein